MTDHDQDDLRRLIRRADPSASLAPLRDDELTRLTEDTMTRTDPAPVGARTPRRDWLLAGGGILVAAAAAAFVLPMALTPPAAPTQLELAPDGGLSASCAQITPEIIGQAEDAFRATVTSIEDGVVTLTVDDRFAGDIADTVEVAQGEDSVIDGAPIVFEDGTTYLIAATDGVIATCGFSNVDSPELDAIYREAFPG
ncbi:hypothetical protein ACIGEP_13675 [Microbacterium sp. NPDC077663]|uniref:hypothetical protein n=1 Tax=Microbacterium sp. NPDC077663 TaxID=3364189 RepID=UPI0037C80969